MKTKGQRCQLDFPSRRPQSPHSFLVLPVHPSLPQLYWWYFICNKSNHAPANILLLLESCVSKNSFSYFCRWKSRQNRSPTAIFCQPLGTLWWTNQFNKLADRMEPPLGSCLSVTVSETDAYIDLFLTVQIWKQRMNCQSGLPSMSGHLTVDPFLKTHTQSKAQAFCSF